MKKQKIKTKKFVEARIFIEDINWYLIIKNKNILPENIIGNLLYENEQKLVEAAFEAMIKAIKPEVNKLVKFYEKNYKEKV